MPANQRFDGVGAEDEVLAQEALADMGVYAPRVLQSAVTAPGVAPEGAGWTCIHSSVSPDGTRWWLWQRFVSGGAQS